MKNDHLQLLLIIAILPVLVLAAPAEAQELRAGTTIELTFPVDSLPPTLYSVMRDVSVPPVLTFHLPDDYDSAKSYPLVVYVPGFDGNVKGNIGNAEAIAGANGWIAATVPLFKKEVDRNEVAGGLIVGVEDAPVIAAAYRTMLGRFFSMVPHVDKDKSAMVGFSNGAQTIAVLLSYHDEFFFDHFRNFCIIDHGMFHLTDLHKKGAKECRYLVLVGDRPDQGRELKIRGSMLLQDEWRLLGVDLTAEVMKDTGHEFNQPQIDIVRRWLNADTQTK